jgi:RNA polymerase sigma-70 factor, ECF subfamily
VRGERTVQLCDLPEAEVIRLAQRGDARAFERLYRQHSARVYALCMRMLRNPDEAEDSMQEVFLHVFRKIQGFRGASAFSTWLHRVTINTVLMRLRRSRMARTEFVENTEINQETGMVRRELGAPDLHVEGYVDRVAIENAIQQLPPRCKMMFVLYDIQGYAHREIANLLGCSVGNAKSQLHKARVRLRQLLLRDANGAESERSRSKRESGRRDGTPFLGPTEPCESV